MSTTKLLITTTIKRKDGSIRKTETKESKSFVLGWLQLIEMLLNHYYAGTGSTVTIKCTDGASSGFSVATQDANLLMAAEESAGYTDYGIIVGTGTTPPASDNHTLETPIAHGSAATQLQYGQCTVNAAAEVGANVDLTIIRTLTNGSGGTITVKEVGLVLSTVYSVSTEKFVLVIRDAVDDAIANTETYVCTYTFRTTV